MCTRVIHCTQYLYTCGHRKVIQWQAIAQGDRLDWHTGKETRVTGTQFASTKGMASERICSVWGQCLYVQPRRSISHVAYWSEPYWQRSLRFDAGTALSKTQGRQLKERTEERANRHMKRHRHVWKHGRAPAKVHLKNQRAQFSMLATSLNSDKAKLLVPINPLHVFPYAKPYPTSQKHRPAKHTSAMF